MAKQNVIAQGTPFHAGRCITNSFPSPIQEATITHLTV
uniref:UDP-N-acetylglucosamine 1-carboxyvinyltransferase n=1 Tax=Steinernema glaseri TaxID=37863 RepID=A0A1I7YHN9_9BILA